MTNDTLARSYLQKCESRLKALSVLQQDGAYSDVVREAQEIVELALKGILRQIGVDPPRWHDVGQALREHRERLPAALSPAVDRLAEISAWLRREREFSFYGDADVIPTEAYGPSQAERASADAEFVVSQARRVIR
jgi:hypothetical protein